MKTMKRKVLPTSSVFEVIDNNPLCENGIDNPYFGSTVATFKTNEYGFPSFAGLKEKDQNRSLPCGNYIIHKKINCVRADHDCIRDIELSINLNTKSCSCLNLQAITLLKYLLFMSVYER